MLFYFFDVEKLIVRVAELDRAIFLLNIYLYIYQKFTFNILIPVRKFINGTIYSDHIETKHKTIAVVNKNRFGPTIHPVVSIIDQSILSLLWQMKPTVRDDLPETRDEPW